jgi:hypothetical protein
MYLFICLYLSAWAVGVAISVVVSCAQTSHANAFLPTNAFNSLPVVVACVSRASLPLSQLCVPDWPWFNRSPVKWWNGKQSKREKDKCEKKVKKGKAT